MQLVVRVYTSIGRLARVYVQQYHGVPRESGPMRDRGLHNTTIA